jgi:hypothetical protein
MPVAQMAFYNHGIINNTIAGGPAPTRAYIEELRPAVPEGRIEPGYIFDRTRALMRRQTAIGR